MINKKGFTLIETIIYIALLGLIMGGTLIAVYQLLQGGVNLNSKRIVQDEGNFVLRKIDWALSGASSFSLPNSSEIVVTKYDGMTANIQLGSGANAGKIIMEENGGIFLPITTDNVQVTNLQFQTVNSGSVIGVAATTTINGTDFAITKYLRQ